MPTTNELLSQRNRKGKRGTTHPKGPNRVHRVEKMDAVLGDMPKEDILKTILKSDMKNLEKTLEQADEEIFEAAAKMILDAREIYIIGMRSCEPLASYLGFYLNLMFDNVKVIHNNSASDLFEQLFRISDQDVLIGISFPRYSMRTLKAMELASNRNAKVISVTDSIYSPMKLYATCNLTACSDMATVIESLTAPMSLINALIAALCVRRQEEMANSLKTLEQVWEEYQVYNNDELNYIDNHIEIKFPGKK